MRWILRSLHAIVCLTIMLSACSSSQANIEIVDAWARPADSGANSAAYFEIVSSVRDDVLLSVSSQIAEKTEIHHTVVDAEGKAGMEHQDRVEIIGGEKISFAPGGYHVMFINLHEALNVGDTFDLTLNFEQAGEVIINVQVQIP